MNLHRKQTLITFRSTQFIQTGETKQRTEEIEATALQSLDREHNVGVAPVFRQGKTVMVSHGMDAFALFTTEDEHTAELVVLMWNYCREISDLGQRIATTFKVKLP